MKLNCILFGQILRKFFLILIGNLSLQVYLKFKKILKLKIKLKSSIQFF